MKHLKKYENFNEILHKFHKKMCQNFNNSDLLEISNIVFKKYNINDELTIPLIKSVFLTNTGPNYTNGEYNSVKFY